MKKLLKILSIFGVIAFLFGVVSCDNGDDDEDTGELKSITLNLTEDEKTLPVGESINITPKVVYNPKKTSTDKALTYTSSDDNIATVDENGLIEAVAPGEVTIKATSTAKPEISNTVVIKVVKNEVTLKFDSLSDMNSKLWIEKGGKEGRYILVDEGATKAKVYTVKAFGGKYYYKAEETSYAVLALDFSAKEYSFFDSNEATAPYETGSFNIDISETDGATLTLKPTTAEGEEPEPEKVFNLSKADIDSYTEENAGEVFGEMTISIRFDPSLDVKKAVFDVLSDESTSFLENYERDVDETGAIVPFYVNGINVDDNGWMGVDYMKVYSDDEMKNPIESVVWKETKITYGENESGENEFNRSRFKFVKDATVELTYGLESTESMEVAITFEGFELEKTDSLTVYYGEDGEAEAEIAADGKSAKVTLEEKYADADGCFNNIRITTDKDIEVNPSPNKIKFDKAGSSITFTLVQPAQ